MTPEDRKLIQTLESQYDSFKPKLEQLQQALTDLQEQYDYYKHLTDFYGSADWFRLREEPLDNLKCGILSEDQLYNLIIDHNELLGDLLNLVNQMYRHI